MSQSVNDGVASSGGIDHHTWEIIDQVWHEIYGRAPETAELPIIVLVVEALRLQQVSV